jgi:hypothetical protein
MSFSHSPDTPDLDESVRREREVFAESAAMMADAMGFSLDRITFDVTFTPATDDSDLGFMQIPKGTVEGRPSMLLDSKIATHGEDETDQGCLGTAMHAVHAIAPICAAAPGIRTFLDLPMITGRGVL